MAKLGLAIAAAELAPAAAPAAPPASADEAIARQQASLRSRLGLDCDRDSAEIVVCGRTGPDPNRLPLPVSPSPARESRGNPPARARRWRAQRPECTTVGRNQRCSGGLPILRIVLFIAQTVVKAALEEEE